MQDTFRHPLEANQLKLFKSEVSYNGKLLEQGQSIHVFWPGSANDRSGNSSSRCEVTGSAKLAAVIAQPPLDDQTLGPATRSGIGFEVQA